MSQDGLLREMLLLKYRLEIFQILLVSNSIGVFWGEGAKAILPPLYKTLGWGPRPCFLRPCGH
jgi:hypothetical protein